MSQEQAYGGFWVRLIALVLDNAVVFIVLLATAVGAGMMAVLESSGWQATVGKRIMGLQVTDADGKPLAVESRRILPKKQDVDQDFTIDFKGPVAKVEFEVAARIIERVFPFSLARGAVAGPPMAESNGITLPPRAMQAAAAASERPLGPAQSQCVFKPVMTDEEIARCRGARRVRVTSL